MLISVNVQKVTKRPEISCFYIKNYVPYHSLCYVVVYMLLYKLTKCLNLHFYNGDPAILPEYEIMACAISSAFNISNFSSNCRCSSGDRDCMSVPTAPGSIKDTRIFLGLSSLR